MARFDLSDAEWRLIEPLLPNKPRGVPRTDSPWRDLPERDGPYTTACPSA